MSLNSNGTVPFLTYLALITYPFGWLLLAPFLLFLILSLGFLHPSIIVISVAYALWLLVFNSDVPVKGGKRVDSWRRFALFRHFANYFPIKLHKTTELDPSNCYIFAHFPHGCVSFSNVINFGTEATGVSATFPGLTFSPLTLEINFYVPIIREFIERMGFGSVSAPSIEYRLTQKGPGQVLSLLVGGAAEAALTSPEEPYICRFSKRKGFVKMALKTG